MCMNVLPKLMLTIALAAPAVGISQSNYEHLPAAGGELLLDWRDDFTSSQQDKLKLWIEEVCTAVTLLHGELPRNQIRISLQANGADSAVPFARVLRESPQGVLFYINPERPLEEFVTDWTAYHEFSHLFIPYPGNSDIWFSEGLASYYQNVVQARAGLLTKNEASEKIRAGFERGRKDSRRADITLGELSSTMRENRAFMRVYWSGALYFLTADVTLRRTAKAAIDNEASVQSLDDVLREFGNCCLSQDRDWTGMEIAAEFDRIAGTELFTPLYLEFEDSNAIPVYAEWLAAPEIDAILSQ
jgi:hypothetical protein